MANPNIKHYLATKEMQEETNADIVALESTIGGHMTNIDDSIADINVKMNAVSVDKVDVFIADFIGSPVTITHGYLHEDERIISTQ